MEDTTTDVAALPTMPASSSSIDMLASALAEAQGEIDPPNKTHTAKVRMKSGGEYSYRYSTLDDMIAALRGPLSKHGLSFTQVVAQKGMLVGVSTLILHKSGQWLCTGTIMLEGGVEPQSQGSALTYARRYSLGAAFGIAAADDDDAVVAQSRAAKSDAKTPVDAQTGPTTPPLQQPAQATPPMTTADKLTLTDKQIDKLRAALRNAGVRASDLKTYLAKTHKVDIASAAQIPQTVFDDVLKWVEAGGKS